MTAQPSKRGGKPNKPIKKPQNLQKKKKTTLGGPGTSQLERDFARDFLDRLGVHYIYQFEAKDIGRWFDFYCIDHRVIIEVDGGYWHGDPRLYEEKDLNRMQKRNQKIDETKNRWAALHCIPIIRVWEKDIRENPQKVMNMLRERLHAQTEVIKKENDKKKRHINRLDEI